MNKLKIISSLLFLVILICYYKWCWQKPNLGIPEISKPDKRLCRDTFLVEEIVLDTNTVEEVIRERLPGREVLVLREDKDKILFDTLSLREFIAKRESFQNNENIYVIRREKKEIIEEYYCNQILVKINEGEKDGAYTRLVDSLKLGLVKSCPCSDYQIWGKEDGDEISPEERGSTGRGLVGQKSGGNGFFFESSLNFIIKVPSSREDFIPNDKPFERNPPGSSTTVNIALIDSGTFPDSSGFIDFRWENPNPGDCFQGDLYGYDFEEDNPVTTINEQIDENGHGSHVAGIILGATFLKGENVNLKIMDLQIFGTGNGSLFDLVCATNYAIVHQAPIINQSLGFYANSAPRILEDVLEKAEAAGILVIASAGNDGLNNNSIIDLATNEKVSHFPSDIDLPNILSIGALGIDSIRLWNESTTSGSNYGSLVDVAAEGENILSASVNGAAVLSGTSMSAGQVTRLAGVLKSKNPGWTYVQLKDCIMEIGNNTGIKGPILPIRLVDTKYGILEPADCN